MNDISFLGKKTFFPKKSNAHISKNEITLHKNKTSKQQYTKPFTAKSLFKHSQGVPPSCNWSNRFTSIYFQNKSHLMYIANTNLVLLDLYTKTFIQIISSYTFNQNERPAILIKYNRTINTNEFICISEYGKILLFSYNDNTSIYNENFNKNNKLLQLNNVNANQNVKCGVLVDNTLLITATCNKDSNGLNDSKLIVNMISNNNDIVSINNGYCIDYSNSNIIDIIVINNNDRQICIALSNGVIELMSFNISNNDKCSKEIIINTPQSSMIFNLDYDSTSNTLFAIDKNGSLYLYTINITEKQHSLKTHIKNKFNDKSINENYLFFCICLITNLPYIIISSNSGRVFIYQYISNEIIELSENPHLSSIFSIIFNANTNEYILFSSDHSISVFHMEIYDDNKIDLLFNYCVYLIGYVPKLLHVYGQKCYIVNKYENNLIIYEYNYMKSNTKLFTKKRVIKIQKDDDVVDMNIIDSNANIVLLTMKKVYLFDYDNNEIKRDIELNGIKCGNVCSNISEALYDNLLLSTFNTKPSVYIISNDKEKLISFDESICNYNKHLIYKCDNKCFISFNYDNNTKDIHIYIFNVLMSFKIGKINIEQVNNEYVFKKELSSFTKACDLFYFIFTTNKRNINIIPLSITQSILSLFNSHIHNYNEYKSTRIAISNSLPIIDNIIIYRNINTSLTNDISCIEILNNIVLVGLNDGLCLIYNIIKDNLILKYQIKAHYAAIIQIKITSSNTELLQLTNEFSFITSSVDHSVKLWNNITECLLLNIYFPFHIEHNELLSSQCVNHYMKTIHFIINQQSLTQSKNFISNYPSYLNNIINLNPDNENDIDLILKYINITYLDEITFTYYNNILLNYFSVFVIIINEYNNISNKKKTNKTDCISNYKHYLTQIITKFKTTNNYSIIDSFLKSTTPNDYSFISNETLQQTQPTNIETLITNKCFIEAMIQIKLSNIGLSAFISCLESFKRHVYSNQLYHVVKIENVIQLLLMKINK